MFTVFKRQNTLVEGVGTSSPPGEEQAESDSLEHPGHSANGNGIKRTLLGEDLADELLVASNRLVNKLQRKVGCL